MRIRREINENKVNGLFDFTPGSTYIEGDLVYFNGELYKCKSPLVTVDKIDSTHFVPWIRHNGLTLDDLNNYFSTLFQDRGDRVGNLSLRDFTQIGVTRTKGSMSGIQYNGHGYVRVTNMSNGYLREFTCNEFSLIMKPGRDEIELTNIINTSDLTQVWSRFSKALGSGLAAREWASKMIEGSMKLSPLKVNSPTIESSWEGGTLLISYGDGGSKSSVTLPIYPNNSIVKDGNTFSLDQNLTFTGPSNIQSIVVLRPF